MRRGMEHLLSELVTRFIYTVFKNFLSRPFEYNETDNTLYLEGGGGGYVDEFIPDEELPDFQEIIIIDEETLIGIEYLDLLPDETAVIRVVGENSFSKQYRKKVNRDKNKEKYIYVNNEKHYLHKARVRP